MAKAMDLEIPRELMQQTAVETAPETMDSGAAQVKMEAAVEAEAEIMQDTAIPMEVAASSPDMDLVVRRGVFLVQTRAQPTEMHQLRLLR